jgi:hypothetical protein
MGWHRQNSGFRGPSVGFALGSLLFAIGAAPGYATTVGAHIGNLTYFAGSLFFTAAAFAEFRFTGRVTPGPSTSRVNRYDWWSALIQFVGTVLFNLSTGAAVIRSLSAPERDEFVWQPDMFGSLCFLVSSGLAVVATTDVDGLWDPHARNWASTWLNAVGSIAFGVSAVGSLVVPATQQLESATAANLGTLIGAVCFLVASLLMRAPDPPRSPVDGTPRGRPSRW